MCLALPSRVLRTDGFIALVEGGGRTREVSLLLLDEEVAVGDYLLVRNGVHAVERVEPARAEEMLALIAEVTAAYDGADQRRW